MSRKPIRFTSLFNGWRRALLNSERTNNGTEYRYQQLCLKYDSLLGVAQRVEENFKRAEARIRRLRREWDEEHEVMDAQLSRQAEQLETAKKVIVTQANDIAKLFAENTERAARDAASLASLNSRAAVAEKEVIHGAHRNRTLTLKVVTTEQRAEDAEALLGRIMVKRDRRRGAATAHRNELGFTLAEEVINAGCNRA